MSSPLVAPAIEDLNSRSMVKNLRQSRPGSITNHLISGLLERPMMGKSHILIQIKLNLGLDLGALLIKIL